MTPSAVPIGPLQVKFRKFLVCFPFLHRISRIGELLRIQKRAHLEARILIYDIQDLNEVPDHLPGGDVDVRADAAEFNLNEIPHILLCDDLGVLIKSGMNIRQLLD